MGCANRGYNEVNGRSPVFLPPTTNLRDNCRNYANFAVIGIMRKLAFILAMLCGLSVLTDRVADRACNFAPAGSSELIDFAAPGREPAGRAASCAAEAAAEYAVSGVFDRTAALDRTTALDRTAAYGQPTVLDRTPVQSSSALSAGSASADRWRCERTCNSDLNLPRLAPVAGPESVTPPQLCGARPASYRHSQQLQLLAAVRCAGRMKATSSFLLTFHSAVPQGADFYVFRLRRLLI